MKILALHSDGDYKKKNVLFEKALPDIELIWIDSINELKDHKNAAAYFDFRKNPAFDFRAFANLTVVPLFVPELSHTLDKFPGIDQLVRINLWPGFMQNAVVEVSAKEPIREKAGEVLKALGWKAQWVADTPGLIGPRILAMVINEAYFALGEDVSTKAEINIAMKLGTNYPFGPFEWADKIGVADIYRLLEKLQATDKRYQIAPSLKSEMS